MTGGTGTVSGADHGWLAKVTAGDPLTCGLLDLARSLLADEWDAFVRCGERMVARMPTADAEAALRQECSRAPS